MLAKGLKVLVIGGGFSGMTAAIQLRKASADVEIVEIDPGWRSYGAGISLQGAALRAFRTLGVLDEFLKRGARHGWRRPLHQRAGHPIGKSADAAARRSGCARTGRHHAPGPLRHSCASDQGSGAAVRLGATFTRIDRRRPIKCACGSPTARRLSYDLVIGADGLGSKTSGNCDLPERAGPALHRPVRLAGRHATPA